MARCPTRRSSRALTYAAYVGFGWLSLGIRSNL